MVYMVVSIYPENHCIISSCYIVFDYMNVECTNAALIYVMIRLHIKYVYYMCILKLLEMYILMTCSLL